MGELQPYPKYKESNHTWIDSVPAHWEEKRAKYFFREVDERSETGDEELLSVSHITGVTPRSQKNINMFLAESYIGSKLCHEGDLVINTMWAWMAALGVAKQTGIVSPSYGVYHPRSRDFFVNEYMDHLLRTQPYASDYICRSTGIGASRLRLYPESFLQIPIIHPPIDEQELAVKYLRWKDHQIRAYIKVKRRQIELLNEQKQVLIHQAVTRGLDPSIPMKPSGIEWLGEIPEHWEIKKIPHLCQKIGSGTTPSSGTREYYSDGSIPWLNTGDLNDGWLDSCSQKITHKAQLDYPILKNYPSGSLVVAMYGATVGKVSLLQFETTCNQACCMLSKFQNILPEFLLFWFIGLRKEILALSRGGGQPNISMGIIRSFRVPIPQLSEQQIIVDFIINRSNSYEKIIEETEEVIKKIYEYRTRLITDIVTGKLDVRQFAASLPDIEDIPIEEPLEEEPEEEFIDENQFGGGL